MLGSEDHPKAALCSYVSAGMRVSQGSLAWCADIVTSSRAWRFYEQFSLKKKEGGNVCASAFTLFLGEKGLVPLVCAISHSPPCPPPAHHLLTVAAGLRHSQFEQNLHKQTNL